MSLMNDEQKQGVVNDTANRKKETIGVVGIIISTAFLLLSGAFNYFGSDPRILYFAAIGLCMFILYGTHVFVGSKLAERDSAKNALEQETQSQPADAPRKQKDTIPPSIPNIENPPQKPSPTTPESIRRKSESIPVNPESTLPKREVTAPKADVPQAATSALAPLSDGQRFVLKKKLAEYAGNTIRLIRIGSDPNTEIVFEQMMDVFQDSGWITQTLTIGTASIVGINFPKVSYLIGPNVAAPIIGSVFSIFASVGVDLPLTPNSFMGMQRPTQPIPETVIVIR